MKIDKPLDPTWQDSIFRQREELARMLKEPLILLAKKCVSEWGDRHLLNKVLQQGFSGIPYCCYLYIINVEGVQLSDNIIDSGITPGYYQKNRSERPYMKEAMPAWGFLLSDAYISLDAHRPSITALQIIVSDAGTQLGYLCAEFDLRRLPVTSALYIEPVKWRQIKGDPSIRGALFRQSRIESLMDLNIENAMSIIEELLTECRVFQCQIHFSSSQITIWTTDDPLRYRILDQEILGDTDICLLYPSQPYPVDADIPRNEISRILGEMQALRMIDTNIYLRMASINIFNGMVSLTFSCDGSHYMHYDEFLNKGIGFWTGQAA
ncbi:MAG: hypothetical protein OQL16_09870 [Gammaproteobacteria bacterium]|nr:hypothetical protein [Gammaproteobacteria bacterium]